MNKHWIRILLGAVLALSAFGWSCLSTQTQTSLDGNNGGTVGTQPFVEAYIEYPGPQLKWAGPGSFLVHIQAREPGNAQITLTPPLAAEPEVDARAPASARKAMTSDEARTQIAHLVTALQGAQAPFRGCMYPVRVRLVRTDGGLFERQGCRSPLGWSRAVSDAASAFIEAAESNRAPASVPAADKK